MTHPDRPVGLNAARSALRLTAALALVCAAGAGAQAAAPSAQPPAPNTVPAESTAAAAPLRWQAPLPHGGQLADLNRWWQQFDDPLLAELIAAAEAASPDLATAAARIAQARAERIGAGAALGPSVNAVASVSRAKIDASLPVATTLSAGLQANWEIDLFGGQRAGRDAAQARLLGASAEWHEARVSLAADMADAYLGLRHCEASAAELEAQARSRGETSRLTALSAAAGFESAGNAALADAAAAQAAAQALGQRSACERAIKSLVALSAMAEPELRRRLKPGEAHLPRPPALVVNEVPALALAQRPDIYRTARNWEAATADLTQSRAQQWPKLSFAGSISPTRTRTGSATFDGTLWSLGPLQLSLPLWDGGGRSANIDGATASVRAAAAAHEAQVRRAVQEVEQALVRLQAAAPSLAESRRAAAGFLTAHAATAARLRAGLASRLELEDALRSLSQAQSQLLSAEQEQVSAWIALYRALGGGWSSATLQDASGTAPSLAPVTR